MVLIILRKSFLSTTMSNCPFSKMYAALWNSIGNSLRIVFFITSLPLKPILAPFSAIFISPNIAMEAVVPPKVGSRQTAIKGN